MVKSIPIIFIAALTLTGCKEEKSEAWYKKNPEATYSTYSQCLKDGESSKNCEFAMRAALMFSHSGQPEIKHKFIKLFEDKEVN